MYSSVTLLFPGQGTQKVGMGSLLKNHPSFELLSKADKILGYNISRLMLEGPEDQLTLTQNTQPAILTYSVGLFLKVNELLKKKNIKIDRVLGHSVGEYAALVAADAISFEDAVMAVHLRGKYMQEATPPGVGKMYAIMRATEKDVRAACEKFSTSDNVVMPANFNEPGQVVISGHADACDKTAKYLEETLASSRVKALPLKVSAPFHSQLMKPAEIKLNEAFNKFTFNPLATAYIANIDATEYPAGTPANIVRGNLIKQVCGSVLWQHSIEKLPSNTLCIEVGPGKVLSAMVRKINRDIKIISTDDENALSEIEGALA